MKNIIAIGILLVAHSLRGSANPLAGVADSETDTFVQTNTNVKNGSTESQIESPEIVETSNPEVESPTDEVIIDTDVNSTLDDSLIESDIESQMDSAKVESCLVNVSKKIDNLHVPAKVEDLANSIRSLNPNLPSEHLTELIVDKRASLDVHTAGFVRDDEMDLYVQECSEFVEKFLEIVGGSECGDNFMNIISPHNEKHYKINMEKHDDVDRMVGYTEACFIL